MHDGAHRSFQHACAPSFSVAAQGEATLGSLSNMWRWMLRWHNGELARARLTISSDPHARACCEASSSKTWALSVRS